MWLRNNLPCVWHERVSHPLFSPLWGYVQMVCICLHYMEWMYLSSLMIICQKSRSGFSQRRVWPWWFSSWALKCDKYYGRVTLLMIKSMQENKIFCYYVLKFIPRNYVFIGGYHYCWQNHTRAFNKKILFKILIFPLSSFCLTHILTWSNICLVGIIRGHDSYWNRNIMDH